MPSLGADMDFGTLVEWTVKPGDRVKRGDIIALVDTEKGLIEIEVFDGGTIESLVVTPGAKVPVGAVLAMINPDGKPTPPPQAPAKAEPSPAPQPTERKPPAPGPLAAAERRTPPRKLRVSPLARRRAAELGIDLSAIAPGEGGVIRVVDVEKARTPGPVAAPAPPSAAVRREPAASPEARLAAMRRAIASAMARSKREIPHYYLQSQAEVGRMLAWLAEENRKRPITDRLLHAVLLLKAVALATREVPEVNGFYVDGAFRPSEQVHVGVAISLRRGGLVAPALHDVDRKPLDQLMKELLDLTKRARSGVLRSSEVADATITVTNLGEQGVESVFGVIYPPQVALVGFGRIVARPWAEGGMVGVRPVLAATLSADHRASDGHRGGRFLSAVGRLLQTPEAL
jgi:pyruvate dehydrogenase E2 component (dihydrolipoyllysine-residue acetyltransferase)